MVMKRKRNSSHGQGGGGNGDTLWAPPVPEWHSNIVFWRDGPLFENLKTTVIPSLLQRVAEHGQDKTSFTSTTATGLRAWCPGCAAGSDSYTLKALIMMVRQQQQDGARHPVVVRAAVPSALNHNTRNTGGPKRIDVSAGLGFAPG